MGVNEVLSVSRRNHIYDTFRDDAEQPAWSRAWSSEETVPFYNDEQPIHVEQTGERAPDTSLSRSHTASVEPGMASSVLNSANIEDVVEQNTRAAHKTFATVKETTLTIGMILVAAVVMFESGRIFF